MPLEHWLQLSLTDGIGPILSRRLIEAAGGPQQACAADASLLAAVEGIGSAKSRKIHESLHEASKMVAEEMRRAAQERVQILCPDDETYPSLLQTIPDPPMVLYVKGTLEPRDLNAFAIVGSRKCSYYGREQAERLAAALAGAGMTIISGGARGIDSAAHRGAISHPQGRTLAVLGSGVDVVYPPENDSLFNQICERGALISEFAFGTPPNKENFPRRNRIVSGMSRGVLVVEADEKSGALITARSANEDHGRPVFALPGRVDNVLSAGPHRLIRDGATLITSAADIIEGLDPLPHHISQPTLFEEPPTSTDGPPEVAIDGLSARQSAILDEMGAEEIDVESIIERTALAAPVVLQELTFLSLKGQVRRIEGQTYVRRRK